MSDEALLQKLADAVRMIYRSGPTNSEDLIEKHLDAELGEIPMEEKLVLLKKLRVQFESPGSVPESRRDLEDEVLSNLFSLLLGRRVAQTDLLSTELLEKLAESLNTIFDSLNELVGVIRSTFMGGGEELQTIRQIIGSGLGGERESMSLRSYLDQIKDAFLLVNRAFRITARNEVGKILVEMDPERLADETERGIKFGFMRKAELFEIYQRKFEQARKWQASERITEEFSREFEKVCQELYKEREGRSEKML